MNLSTHNAGRGRWCTVASPRRAAAPRGFSLIEIMLVLVLLAALTALAVPTFDSMLGGATFSETTRQVAAAIDEAGADAQVRGVALDVNAVRSASGGWSLVASPLTLAGGDQDLMEKAEVPRATPAPRRTLIRLPDGFEFQAPTEGSDEPAESASQTREPAAAGEKLPVCVLWPTGEATPLGELQIRDRNGAWATFAVSALTGRCRVKVGAAGPPAPSSSGEKSPARATPALGAPDPEPASDAKGAGR